MSSNMPLKSASNVNSPCHESVLTKAASHHKSCQESAVPHIKFQTPYALKTRKSSSSSNTNANTNASFVSPATPAPHLPTKLENDWDCYTSPNDAGFLNGSYGEPSGQCCTGYDEDDIDDSQEDSSGYYSSYHSVDLISSSGGSSGGDLLLSKQQQHTKHAWVMPNRLILMLLN